MVELLPKLKEVLSDFGLGVESQGSFPVRVVVYHSVDQVFSVALLEKDLDLGGRSTEGQHVGQLAEFHGLVEGFALLEDSHGESPLDEWFVPQEFFVLQDFF